MKLLIAALLPITLTACATTQAPPAPSMPVLSCDDCSGLRYYGHQAPPQSETAKIVGVIAGAVTQVAGYGYAADAVKSVTNTAASAGRIQVLEQPAPTVVRPEIVRVPTLSTAETTTE